MRPSQNPIIKFINTSGIFLVGSVLSKAITFFMLPLYTSYINPTDYGYYDLSITYITLFAGFLFFDVWTSVMRYMYDRHTEEEKYDAIFSGWVIFGISSLVYCIIATIFILLTDVRYAFYIFLYGLMMNFVNMYSFIVRGLGRNTDFAISGIISTVATVAVNIVLIVAYHWDFSSLYIAGIVGFSLQVLYLELRIKTWNHFKYGRIKRDLTVAMFRYSLPLCLNTVAYWLLNSFNRVVINYIYGDQMNGFFAVGSKFGIIISLVTTCFTYAWQDLSFSHTSENGNDGSFYTKACNTYMKFLGAGAAVLIPASYIVFPFFIDKSYAQAKNTVPLFLLVGLISALSTFIGNIFYAIKNTRIIFISMVVSCLVNVALCYPLIKYMGMNGANLSVFISFALNIILRNWILHKEVAFRLDLKLVFLLFIWIGLSILVYQYGTTWMNLVWLSLCIGFTLFLFRDMMISVIRNLRSHFKKEA